MKKLITLFVISIALFGCEKEEQCIEYKTGEVIAVQGAIQIPYNETLQLDVIVEKPNKCSDFDRFILNAKGPVYEITPVFRQNDCNCSQTDETVKRKLEINFPSLIKTYELQFLHPNPKKAKVHYVSTIKPR